MPYILQSVILVIWLVYLIKKERYSNHAILTTYLLFVMVVDIPEVTNNHLLEFYKFPTHLLANPDKDNQFGIIFSDGIILPLTTVILLHYAVHTQKLWRLSFAFAATYGLLEWMYLRYSYLTYLNWNIWISIAVYLFMSRIFSHYAPRLLLYQPPIPYFIRIGGATYAITAWFGAVLGGAFLGLYQWRPLIFAHESSDDRLADLGISLTFAILSAVIIPRIRLTLRPLVFLIFALMAISFSYVAHDRGWLIYHHWNTFLTVLRWIVPFAALTWFDRWEFTYLPAKQDIPLNDLKQK